MLVGFDLELTAIDMRHIEHSEECVDALSPSFFSAVFPKSRSRLWVVTLSLHQYSENAPFLRNVLT